MEFRKSSSPDRVAEFIATQISGKLANDKKVLWLVPGGSAAVVAIAASRLVTGVDSSLYISLTDERPGPPGHSSSNWQQLKTSGFNYQNREYYEILQNRSNEEDAQAFGAWLSTTLTLADFKLGLFGIGVDGHTAGVLTTAKTEPQPVALTAYYSSSTAQRISVTPLLISRLDMAVVYAVGQDKQPVLEALDKGPSGLPMDALRLCPQVFVYNDYKGEEF